MGGCGVEERDPRERSFLYEASIICLVEHCGQLILEPVIRHRLLAALKLLVVLQAGFEPATRCLEVI